MASATPFGGGNQPTFAKYLQGYGPGSPFMPARLYGGGVAGPVAAGGAGAGALPGTYNPASGGIPKTPTLTESLANLLSGIQGKAGDISSVIGALTGAENKALRDQYPASYFDTLGTLMGNVANRAKGNVSDLLPQLGQLGAEWGIGQGVAGGPAYESKLARDVFGSAKAVQDLALQQAGAIQNLIPKVNPFSAANLVPNYGENTGWMDLANVRGAAPIPESAYARARADALAGLNRGFNAGGGGGYGWFNPMARPTVGAVGPAGSAGAVSPFFSPPGGGGDWLNSAGTQRGLPAQWPPSPEFAWPAAPLPGPAGPFPPPFEGGPSWEETTPNLWDNPFDVPPAVFNEPFAEEAFRLPNRAVI